LYKTWGKLQQTIFDFISAYTTTAARIIHTAHVQPRLTVETVNLLLPGDFEGEVVEGGGCMRFSVLVGVVARLVGVVARLVGVVASKDMPGLTVIHMVDVISVALTQSL
jgi:hypothetical protein